MVLIEKRILIFFRPENFFKPDINKNVLIYRFIHKICLILLKTGKNQYASMLLVSDWNQRALIFLVQNIEFFLGRGGGG